MKQRKYSPFRFGFALGTGALIASVLCIQCVRTYLYTDDVLVPQQAEREAERQVGALTTAARSAGITDPRALGPAIEHVLESSSDRVLWIRLLDPESKLPKSRHSGGSASKHMKALDLWSTQCKGRRWSPCSPFGCRAHRIRLTPRDRNDPVPAYLSLGTDRQPASSKSLSLSKPSCALSRDCGIISSSA